MSRPLNLSLRATFASDGAGSTVARARTGPDVYGTTWKVQRVVTSTTSVDSASRLYVYLNAEQPSGLVDATYSGNQDTSESEIKLLLGDRLIFVWTGGDVGAEAAVVLMGTVEGR